MRTFIKIISVLTIIIGLIGMGISFELEGCLVPGALSSLGVFIGLFSYTEV